MQNDKKYLPSIYEIVVSNYLDDCNYSILVLSHEPLTKDSAHINQLAKLDDNEQYYFVSRVNVPEIKWNCYTEKEYEELLKIKSLINNK
jgi:hypothetical protein